MRIAAALGVTLALGVLAWRPGAALVSDTRRSVAMESARRVSASGAFEVRLSGPRAGTWAAAFAGRIPAKPPHAAKAANRLMGLASFATGDDEARARGVAWFLIREWGNAIDALQSIRDRDARDWNDLAAAQLAHANGQRRMTSWLAALVSVDRALALDPSLAEARFNRARILDAIGIRQAAQVEWKRYLRLDARDPWAVAARRGAEPLPASERDAWRVATAEFDRMDPDRLAALTRQYPETARRFTEAVYLASWAESVKRREPSVAGRLYERIVVIARTLQKETGESLLAETMRRIDRDAPPSALLDGLIAYSQGRFAQSVFDIQRAEERLRLAETLLRSCGSPLAEMARFYVANAIGDRGHTAEAVELLDAMRRDVRSTPSYRALSAHVHYHLAFLEAVQGHWSVSLSHAKEALAGFSAIREPNNAAIAQAVLSEDYDLIGQRELALNEGREAVRRASALGDIEFARQTLAVLCRTELRAGAPAGARSLALIESELARLETLPRLDPHMHLRRATAEWQLGNAAAATTALARARKAAHVFKDGAVRSKLLADVDATEGTFVRRVDPPRAIALLAKAIEYQQQSARALLLPELYLQRGRAYLASNELRRAASDFNAGIVELERQRSHLMDGELRPGIFDSAGELFDEAIALQIARGAGMEDVFAYVERGRARAVLEQLNALDGDVGALKIARLADIQRNLNPGAVLIEYASLPRRLVAFVIRRERAVMRTIPIAREALRAAAQSFTRDGGENGAALNELLLTPLQSDLHGVESINFVGDDILERIPFAALRDVRSRTFLIERYVVASSPSAGVYLATRDLARRLPDRPPASALIFGNPAIPRDEFGDLASLIASESEAAYVARRYPHAGKFVGDAATAERFIELAPRFEIVYFAGHGVINEREPYASALVCAATPRRKGGVTSREIARMRFDATRVVVLAACSTMTGQRAVIEGAPSLSKAFIVAGVPAVVGTLWDVDDEEAGAIVRPLHEQLARGASPAVALQAAQMMAIRQGLPTSQWSAFALMGAN